MSESVCQLCDSPVPIGLAMLASCHHMGHAKCISNYVRRNGCCWLPSCAMAAVESQVLVLHIDSPQSNWIGLNEQQSVREVIGVIRQRLVAKPKNANTAESDFEEVANIFESLTSPHLKPNQSNNVVAEERADQWEKLLDLVKRASPIILAAVFALLCWYGGPLVLSFGAALFDALSSLVMGLSAFLRNFFPEIVASGLAFFSAFVLGNKKLED